MSILLIQGYNAAFCSLQVLRKIYLRMVMPINTDIWGEAWKTVVIDCLKKFLEPLNR